MCVVLLETRNPATMVGHGFMSLLHTLLAHVPADCQISALA